MICLSARLLQFSIAALTIFLQFSGATAQTASEAEQLTAVSNELFARHKVEYIMADALTDGLVKDGQEFRLHYEAGEVGLNGNNLPAYLRDTYLDRLSEFYNNGRIGKADTAMHSFMTTLHKSELLDRNSSLHRSARFPDFTRGSEEGAIISELAMDGLAVAGKPARVELTAAHFKVNDKTIEGAPADKYRMLFRILLRFVPTKETDIYLLIAHP